MAAIFDWKQPNIVVLAPEVAMNVLIMTLWMLFPLVVLLWELWFRREALLHRQTHAAIVLGGERPSMDS
jgi:hypothetical protein